MAYPNDDQGAQCEAMFCTLQPKWLATVPHPEPCSCRTHNRNSDVPSPPLGGRGLTRPTPAALQSPSQPRPLACALAIAVVSVGPSQARPSAL